MNNFGLVRLFGFAVAFSFASFQIAAPAASKPVRYTLLSDSQFIKDCLICAIPTMFFPLRGTFDLIETDVGPQFTTYRIENVSFRAGFGTNSDYVITGDGVDYVETHLPSNKLIHRLLMAAESGATRTATREPEQG